MDEVKDTLLCDRKAYEIDLGVKYDSVLWTDGFNVNKRWLVNAGYYKFRAWQGVCWDDDSLTVRTDSKPQLSIAGDSFFCEGGSSLLRLNASPSSGEFKWQDGSTDSAFNTDHSVVLRVESKNECGTTEVHYPVREIILPELAIKGDSIYCPGNEVALKAINYLPYWPRWRDGQEGPDHLVDSGIYHVTIQDQNCMTSDSFQVYFRPHPLAEVDHDFKLCDFQPLILESSQALTSRLWSSGDTAQIADYTNEEGDHWLKVYNACGIDSAPFIIDREYCTCDLLVPNAFTPNGDMHNPRFKATPQCNDLRYYQLEVYDRWGQRLYISEDIEQGWDGRYKNELMPQDVYLWVIRYKGIQGRSLEQFSVSGTVHLLR
jgi:gliding motility-associated-like protein